MPSQRAESANRMNSDVTITKEARKRCRLRVHQCSNKATKIGPNAPSPTVRQDRDGVEPDLHHGEIGSGCSWMRIMTWVARASPYRRRAAAIAAGAGRERDLHDRRRTR